AWETTYLHVLQGADPVTEWYRGTGLRPVLAALGPDRAEEFVADYGERARAAYPRAQDRAVRPAPPGVGGAPRPGARPDRHTADRAGAHQPAPADPHRPAPAGHTGRHGQRRRLGCGDAATGRPVPARSAASWLPWRRCSASCPAVTARSRPG